MEGNICGNMSLDRLDVVVKVEPLWERTDSHGVSAHAHVCTNHEVKEPPDSVFTTHVHIKEEIVKCLKVEWEDEALYGASESALVDLYAGHEVKDELVLGPEGVQPADVAYALALNAKEQPVVKDCVVRIERLEFRLVENNSNQVKEIHRNTNLNTEKQFVCDICNKSFKLKTQIMKHVMIHIHESSQVERTRGVVDNERARQKYHRIQLKSNKSRVPVGGNLKNEEMETAGQQTSVLRQVCSEKDVGETPLLKHLKTTNKSKDATSYKCGWCSYTCYQKHHLLVHERKHTGEKPYKCSHCEYASAHKLHLLNHLRKHTGEKPYKCSHCNYTAIRKSYLLVHEIKHTGEKPYKCKHCSYATIHKNYLQVHDKIHTGEKLYQCSNCSYASDRKSNLLVHEKIHTGEKPYTCSNCSYACKRKDHLRSHEKKHRKSYLLVHEIIHTGVKPYKCSNCSYACKRKGHLRSHKKIHTGEKPFKCSECSYASAHKCALRVHERRHRQETLQM